MHILQKRGEPLNLTGFEVYPDQPVGPTHGLNGHHRPSVRRRRGLSQASAPRNPALTALGVDMDQIGSNPKGAGELHLGHHERTVREPREVRQAIQSCELTVVRPVRVAHAKLDVGPSVGPDERQSCSVRRNRREERPPPLSGESLPRGNRSSRGQRISQGLEPGL